MKLSPFAVLVLVASCGNEAVQQDRAAQDAAASVEGAMETIFGGKENLNQARERALAERARQETPKPVWDPVTHDAVRELWTRSVQRTLLEVAIELDGAAREELNEARRSLSTLIDENHADFENALDAWPSLKGAALQRLDAEKDRTLREAEETAAVYARLAEKGAIVRDAQALEAETTAAREKIEQQRSDVEALDRHLVRDGGS